MSAEPVLARPSETPTLAHRAHVDSDLRCPHCSKRMVDEPRTNAEGITTIVPTCLSCSPWTTDGEDYDTTFGLTYVWDDERVIAAGRALRKGAA
jgi:hypothetical protein